MLNSACAWGWGSSNPALAGLALTIAQRNCHWSARPGPARPGRARPGPARPGPALSVPAVPAAAAAAAHYFDGTVSTSMLPALIPP